MWILWNGVMKWSIGVECWSVKTCSCISTILYSLHHNWYIVPLLYWIWWPFCQCVAAGHPCSNCFENQLSWLKLSTPSASSDMPVDQTAHWLTSLDCWIVVVSQTWECTETKLNYSANNLPTGETSEGFVNGKWYLLIIGFCDSCSTLGSD